jgi:hypothetical protein
MVKSKYGPGALSLVVIFLFSFLILGSLTPHGAATTPDSIAYLDIAGNLRDGNGFNVTDFSLDAYGVSPVKTQRAWPPLYAALLSVFIDNSSDVLVAASVSKILLFISVYCVFLILLPIAGRGLSLLLSCLFCICVPILTVYTYAWSETLFLALVGISSCFSILYLKLDSEVGKAACMLALLLALIGVAYTRYIGIIYISILGMTYFLSSRSRLDHVLFVVASAVYIATVGYWLYRNYVLSGYLSGSERVASNTSPLENFDLLIASFQPLLPEKLAVFVFIGAFALLFVYAVRRSQKPLSLSEHAGKQQTLVILAVPCALYLSALVFLSSVSQFDTIDVRLLSPAFPAIFMIAVVIASRLDVRSGRFLVLGACSFFLIASFSIRGYQQYLESMQNWREQGGPLFLKSPELTFNNFTKGKNDNKVVFTKLVSPGGFLVMSNAPLQAFLTGLDVIEKPREFTAQTISRLNALPEGSALVILRSGEPALSQVLAGLNIDAQYINLGSVLALKIPVKKNE